MALLVRCWAPCFRLNSGFATLRNGSIIIALYCAFLHILILFYSLYILMGGQSDTFYSPLFEFNRYGMNVASILLVIFSISYIFFCCFGLIHGIKTETRFYYLPFLYITLLEILLVVSFAIFMVYRYYHNEWATFAALIMWSFSGYHFYLYLVVTSLYYEVKNLQKPTFIVLYP
ncbi:uncharacterized protein LOC128958742 [Oppia nitens]|uniref:uncharacterized protein LOC128958742 n=1 Tax=Oppia nitens TaxID=1686743 RepID=UPI0023DAC3F3|nr:uncharacterized protein LOC128958742 [Oppia nitens]